MIANTQYPRMGLLVGILVALFVLSLGFFSYGNMAAGSEVWQILLSALILAIPVGLLYFSIGLLIVASWQRRAQGGINARIARFIYLTPRIAGILIAVFVGLFALDVFGEQGTIWQQLLAFVMHAAPAIFMGILVAIAWRRPVVGFVAFLLAAIFFLRFLLGDLLQGIGNFILFSGPMAFIAALFYVNWKWAKELQAAPKA